MSIFNVLSTKARIPGTIKSHTAKNSNFGHFSMEIKKFKEAFSEDITSINTNMRAKNIDGELVFVDFINHDGYNC